MKIRGLIELKFSILIFFVYSIVCFGVIKEYVRKFLMYEVIVYGDIIFIEFIDGFLFEYVKFVCVFDIEMVFKDR